MSSSQESYTLKPAKIKVTDEKTLFSLDFQDIYYPAIGGLEQAEYIFLKLNYLRERWSQKPIEEPFLGKAFTNFSESFVIMEFGFGTGLNFFLTCDLWLSLGEKNQCKGLYFISFEKYPVPKNALVQIVRSWGIDNFVIEQFLESYSESIRGLHKYVFDTKDGRKITLDLFIGDILEGLNSLAIRPERQVDAVYLDGFAPSKNSLMWSLEVISRLSDFCKVSSCTITSFSVAGFVKNSLKDNGFRIKKVKGTGGKRENLLGVFEGNIKLTNNRNLDPWFHPQITKNNPNKPLKIAVIGAGLSGCQTARALANAGFNVDVLEKSSAIAAGASGNYQGAVYTKLAKQPTNVSRFHLQAYLFSLKFLDQLQESYKSKNFWNPCGLFQGFSESKDIENLKHLIKNNDFLEDFFRFEKREYLKNNQDGIYFPKSGYVLPPVLCAVLIDHPLINLQLNKKVNALKYDEKISKWLLEIKEENSQAEYDIVIIANAYGVEKLLDSRLLGVKKIRGQVTYLSGASYEPHKSVYATNQYFIPAHQGIATVGASYNLKSSSLEISEEEDTENLKALDIFEGIDSKNMALNNIVGSRVSFRAASKDFLPMVGEVPDIDSYIKEYSGLSHGKTMNYGFAKSLPSLYVNVAHGSKGLVTTPISAQIILEKIRSRPLPVTSDIASALHPARFLIRKIKRKML